ncbi:MAG TPA: geranylgeranylglycerol-phosphate geranylgeranyltransferase [Thermoplasmata archaeon]|nr:geranylgeranylglycerol-phosphate geranylgeranyltransferase [Thermoplasmata archaeon]
MGPYLRLVRVGNVATSGVGTAVAALAVLGNGLSTGCVTAGGNVLNDRGDQASDRRNHPDRPLVTGSISERSARRLAIGLFVVGAALIVPLLGSVPTLGLVFVSALAALFAYEFRFKREGLSGNLLVGYLTAAVFLYGGAAVGSVLLSTPFAVMAFGATLSREVIKDMEDAEGDIDRRTLPRVRGMGVSSAAARGAVAIAIVLSPVPLLSFLPISGAAGIAYLAFVALADLVFIASVWWLPQRLHREQLLSKAAMSIALGAFLAATFR